MVVDKNRIARAVGRERYDRGRRIAFVTAPRCGRGLRLSVAQHEDDRELFDVVDDVLDAAFAGVDANGDKMRATCALYQDFPSYTIIAQLFTTIGYDGLTSAEMTFFLEFLGAMISAEALELARPAEYVLWVDFFEDDSRVDAAWNTVCGAISSDEGWRRLLIASGPVPEGLKMPVIERFRPDPSFHDAIFEALSGGVFDIYGRIERANVESILPALRIDRSHPAYHQLLVRLADPAPIEFEWQLKT
ncbi:MAG TPA: hypothetical protein VGC72_03395 [Candidatus Elarobacter sp.]